MPPVKKPKVKISTNLEKEETTPVISGQLQKKLQRKQDRQRLRRGVVLIRHLPHGFFEDQLRGYFEQFGTVTRLRLARSKLTGGTKGYAYIEFEYPEVAEVAAETMDNYLMFNKVVKAAYIPPEKQIYNFFRSSVRQVKNKAGKAIYVSAKTTAIARQVKKFNESSEETYQKRTARKLKKIDKLNEKHGHLGIDFNQFLVGSKKIDKKEIETKTGTTGFAEETPKTGKRKLKSSEKLTKKSKKVPELKDLLGNTLNDDSDDETYENEEEDTKDNLNQSVNLEDLLGATLNDDSDDEDYLENSDNSESASEDNEHISETEENSDANESSEDEDDDNENYNVILQKLKAKKKATTAKKGDIEQLIKRKKHAGAIQKSGKLIKKPKTAYVKNALQIALAKKLAKPLPVIKQKIKIKKQKV